jgi:hypothetical protein
MGGGQSSAGSFLFCSHRRLSRKITKELTLYYNPRRRKGQYISLFFHFF